MKVESYEVQFVGVTISGEKFVLPAVASDPAAPDDGWMWYNTTTDLVKFRANGVTISVGAGSTNLVFVAAPTNGVITSDTGTDATILAADGTNAGFMIPAQFTKLAGIANSATANDTDANLKARANHTGTQPISSILAAASARLFGRVTASGGPGEELTLAQVKTFLALATADISNFNTSADARVVAVVTAAFVNALSGVDADTLNGSSAAALQTAITAAIVDTAPGTLDTLNEIAAALGDDPNFLATITALANSRARSYTAALTGGAATEAVNHNLNTRDLLEPTVYVASGNYEDEGYIFRRTSVNQVTVVSEAGNIPSGRRIVIVAVGT